MRFSVQWFDTLESTNTYLRDLLDAHPGLPAGTLIAAREQTGGRGRQGRHWETGAGRNLAFSFLMRANNEQEKAIPALTMAVALAVDDLLLEMGLASHPKWPNDVLVNGAKICGILSEKVLNSGVVVVGVGLNVNMTREEAEDIDRPATSILIETGDRTEPESVLEALLPRLPAWIERWEASGFSGIRDTWIQRFGETGRSITVRDGDHSCSGRWVGFGEDGELCLEEASGSVRRFWSGDVELNG